MATGRTSAPPRRSTPWSRRFGVVLAVVAAAATLGGQPVTSASAVTPLAPDGPGQLTPTARATPARPTVTRLGGADRYATSVATTRAAFPSTRPPVVYLVPAGSPWHALTTAPAAARRGGAVLLTASGDIPDVVTAELRRLAPSEIVVVGSAEVLTDDVVREARAYAATVRRVGGATRYRTGEAVVRDAFPAGSVTEAWITTGSVWTAALSAGAVAGAHRAPLITVLGTRAGLAPTTRRLLLDLGVRKVTLAGSTSLVSAAIETDLRELLGADSVVRAAGRDRYAVNAELVRLGLPDRAPGPAYVVAGRDHVGALTAGYLAGLRARPMVLTLPYCTVAPVRPLLASARVDRVVLVGGETVLRSLVGTLEPCRSTTAPDSPWVLVNKQNALRPADHEPTGLVVPSGVTAQGHRLRADAASALSAMVAAARAEGAGGLAMTSGYRSASTQRALFQRRLAANGREHTERWTARPGHSEHQTGLTVDLAPLGAGGCTTHRCLGTTSQGRWLQANAWRFGYLLRYEGGATAVTGFGTEPWHFRFVGEPLAAAYRRGGWHTYEEFLGAPAAPTY